MQIALLVGHYMDRSMGHLIITETGTLHCKYIDIHVEFIPLLHLQKYIVWVKNIDFSFMPKIIWTLSKDQVPWR